MSFTTNDRPRPQRKVLLGTALLALGTLLALGAQSCVTLPAIPENQCGNGVVEPGNGEACDDASEDCGQPSTTAACRHLCKYGDATPKGRCPMGFGCGLDGICRKSDGLSNSSISIAGGGTQKLLRGDFDGDLRDDIVAVGLSTADVHFTTTEGLVDRTVSLPNERGMPGIGDIDGDQRSDIVLALDRSLGVLLGQEDRTFVAKGQPTMYVANTTRELIPLGDFTQDGLLLQVSEIQEPAPTMGTYTVLEFIALGPFGDHTHVGGTIAKLQGSYVGAIATTGVVKGNDACGVVAFELAASVNPTPQPARVAICERCVTATKDPDYINLPPGAKPWAGTYLANPDKNGQRYLFFGVDNFIKTLQYVKIDESGVVTPPDKFLEVEAGNCVTAVPNLASEPLAIGDVNGDGFPDVIDSRGVILYNPENPMRQFTRLCLTHAVVDPMDPQQLPVGWTTAVIGDFNGDKRNDVLAARKGVGVLDLWSWQAGGFNTVPIFVGGEVHEIVSGDLDGDGLADAAFRFMEPPNPMEPSANAEALSPLFAIFGNPLALPSSPRVVGFFPPMEQLTAGRIRGWNAADEVDVISDIAILSPTSQEGDKPLTIVQGNPTRNLVAPLTLQSNARTDVMFTDEIYGISVSEFGVGACDTPTQRGDQTLSPSNIVALGEGTIWLAGCSADGSSLPIDRDISVFNAPFLFAPVDPLPAENGSATKATQLATFMNTPTYSPMGEMPDYKVGIGQIEYTGTATDPKTFKPLDTELPTIDDDTVLPTYTSPDTPYLFADMNGDGRRDVILTAQTETRRTVFIYWSKSDKPPFEIKDATFFDLPVGNGSMPGGMGSPDEIVDVAAINLDGDRFKELAILTRASLYLMKLKLQQMPDDSAAEPALDSTLDLDWFDTSAPLTPFTSVRGGQALLAVDANSDGIDDLIIADEGKLLLYLGKERLK